MVRDFQHGPFVSRFADNHQHLAQPEPALLSFGLAGADASLRRVAPGAVRCSAIRARSFGPRRPRARQKLKSMF